MQRDNGFNTAVLNKSLAKKIGLLVMIFLFSLKPKELLDIIASDVTAPSHKNVL